MPLVYAGTCLSCGTTVGASDSATALWRDDGAVTVLRHPCETHDLERLGHTWASAERERRLVSSTDVICADCRTVHPVYQLRYGSGLGGCGWWLLLTMLGCGLALWLRQPGLAALSGIGFFVMILAFDCAARFRAGLDPTFRARAAALAERSRCPTCGGVRRRGLRPLRARLVRCPQCATPRIQLKNVGVS